jgi:hypothetical protein
MRKKQGRRGGEKGGDCRRRCDAGEALGRDQPGHRHWKQPQGRGHLELESRRGEEGVQKVHLIYLWGPQRLIFYFFNSKQGLETVLSGCLGKKEKEKKRRK